MISVLLTSLALAQSPAVLTDGTPEFGCTASDSCPRFYGFLSHSMVEQGFTLEHVDSGAAIYHLPEPGLRLGGALTTFPFAGPRENLSGKEENTAFSPVLPRLQVGGSQVSDDWVTAADLAFTPPVPVGGASALVGSLTLGVARTVRDGVRLGGELAFTGVSVRAPIVATEEQFEEREDWENPDNLDPETYEAVCGSQPNGCVDRFSLANSAVRVGFAVDLPAQLVVTTRLGLGYLREQLWVQYDDTTWVLQGLQARAHLDVAWRYRERLSIGLGTSLAYRPPGLSESGSAGALFKLRGAISWRFWP